MIAAIVTLVVGGAAYLALSPRLGSHRPPVTPAPTSAGSAAASLPAGPDGIAGQTLAWDRDLRVPAAGTQPAWFSPASGSDEPIDGLPADGSGYQFTRVVGGWAVQASPARPSGCDSCAGPPAPVWFLRDGARSATRIGTANLVAPADIAGTVWLTSYPVGASMTTTAGTARETRATGASSRTVKLPPGYAIDRGTDHGLLLARINQQPGKVYALWDPSALKASPVFEGVLATGPGEIAWTSLCTAAPCIQVLNLATGGRSQVAVPVGSSAVNGAFSPDGRFLAFELSSGAGGDSGGLAMRLEVATVTSGLLTPVPGTWVSSDALIGFGWPSAGDSLVAEFSFTTKTQLASWHPGASRAAVTVIRPEGSLILG